MTRRADPLPASQASPPKARPRAVPQTSDLLAKLVRPTKPTRVPELDRIERLISSHTHYHLGYSGETIPAQTIANELKRVQTIVDEKQRQEASAALARTFKVLAGVPEHLSRMAVIEQAMEAHEAQATPKTRDGSALMQSFIDDTRTIYRQAVPDPAGLQEALKALQ